MTASLPLLRRIVRRAAALYRPGSDPGAFDVFAPADLGPVLAPFGLPLPVPDPAAADRDVPGAVGFILGVVFTSRRVRRRFPGGLGGGPSSALCEWLAGPGGGKFQLTGRAAGHVREAFAARPGDRARRVYEARVDLRGSYPLGLIPPGRADFARWLLGCGRAEHGLTADEVLWYLFELADDPAAGLADTYLLRPDWQRAVPHGLTVFGWADLLAWVDRAHGPFARWPRAARLPPRYGSWDQLLMLWGAFPDRRPAAAVAAARAGDPEPLARWAAAQTPPPPAGWVAALRREVAAGLTARPGVNVVGHFRYPCGLQEEAVQYVRALGGHGVRVARRDSPVCYPAGDADPTLYTDPELFDVSLVKIGACEWLDDTYARAGLHPRPGAYRVACWSWELEAFPAESVARAGLADEVWTPSEFCARAVRAAAPGKPVFAMLPAVAAPPERPPPRDRLGLPADRFVFLFLFDMGSVMERKNPLGLIRAFRRAFRPSEPVELVIKVSRADARPADRDRLLAAAGRAGVAVIDRVLPRADALGLIAACDAYVSLHRAEGFGFSVAEAMMLGKPTVATGYSGNLDFTPPGAGYLVDYRLVPVGPGHPPYPADARWAEPSEEHAAELMRRVFDRPDEAAAVGQRGREAVRALLSPAAAADRMLARLRQIWDS